MSDYECCASGSCEVCRRPSGYSQAFREELRDYEPPESPEAVTGDE